MFWRRVSAWILITVVALSSGPVQAFVHVCSNLGPHWNEDSCSAEHHSQTSCCATKPSPKTKNCCESVYLFGLSAKYKDRVPHSADLDQTWFRHSDKKAMNLVFSFISQGFSDTRVQPPIPDRRLLTQRINQ